MATLYIYTATHCASCSTTREIAAHVRRVRPHQAVALVTLDQAGVEPPPCVFGTPTYCLDDRVIFLGNPEAETLLAVLDREEIDNGEIVDLV